MKIINISKKAVGNKQQYIRVNYEVHIGISKFYGHNIFKEEDHKKIDAFIKDVQTEGGQNRGYMIGESYNGNVNLKLVKPKKDKPKENESSFHGDNGAWVKD